MENELWRRSGKTGRGLLALVCLSLFSCSVTKDLPEGEQLYVGVKKMKLETPPGLKMNSVQNAAFSSPLSVAPNNPLYSPYLRWPIPTGLWVNGWEIRKEKGVKWWLYRNFAKKPVLVSNVQPELRLKMVETNLKNFGFFDVRTRYQVIPRKKNPQKAKISYWVEAGQPCRYGSIGLWGWKPAMDSLVQNSMAYSLLKSGDRYDVNILDEERKRIASCLRDEGYYFFQPDHIEFRMDTTRIPGRADVRIGVKEGVPREALEVYRIGKMRLELSRNDMSGRLDSLELEGVNMVYEPPVTLKPHVLMRALKMRPGQKYSASVQKASQAGMVQLGVFKYANLTITADSLSRNELKVDIKGEFALPIETEVEVDVASKSNNLMGPSLILGIINRNMFKRAENFSVRLSGSYEWQMGGNKESAGSSDLINSYELGLNVNLSVPRLLMPRLLKPRSESREQTQFQIGADLLNRHSYFRMVTFGGSAVYDFNTSLHRYHSIVPFKLNYTYMLETSPAFDSVIMRNPAVEQSFHNQFIPSMSYSYTYDRTPDYRSPNRLFWQVSLTQAGNIISGLQSLCGNRGKGKEFLNNYYSQFLKLNTELIGYKSFGNGNQLALRVVAGVGYAYGNSDVMPYSEQFYIGGSNSIRAFHIRTIGPGCYHPEESLYSYLDQTGEIKLEGNIEYRFKVYEALKGALFMDAGNIWLLTDEAERPGGRLEADRLFRQIALGTGFGLRYDFSYLVVRADVGIPLHLPYDTGKSGYYNIRGGFGKSMVLNLAIGYPF